MKEFRLRKPVKAIQYTGNNIADFKKELPDHSVVENLALLVVRLNGWTRCLHVGDWIVFPSNNSLPETMGNKEFQEKYISNDIQDLPIQSFA